MVGEGGGIMWARGTSHQFLGGRRVPQNGVGRQVKAHSILISRERSRGAPRGAPRLAAEPEGRCGANMTHARAQV